MPIHATVILDSGCFLPMDKKKNKNPKATEIGHFKSGESVPDIRVRADGNDVKAPKLADLGSERCRIEVRHVKADGSIKRDNVKGAKGFHENLLHMRDLYGKNLSVDPEKFDCIIRFESGLFCAGLIKMRSFKAHKRQENGEFQSLDKKPKEMKKPIMHNVFIHFNLKDGEALEIAKDGEVIWSSKNSRAKNMLEVELVADNTTAEKFYSMALKDQRESYWMPNQGDPPPVCSQPPCEP